MPIDLPHDVIPGYTLKRLLGKGGMAAVYLAEQSNLRRDVALKIMAPELAESVGFAARFLAEARMTAGLHHPNVMTIHDVGQVDYGQRIMSFLAAELLSFGTLKERMPELQHLSDKLRILRGVARGIGHAHQHGIIHRDIKPINIMFRDAVQPVVTDFGIAKALAGGEHLTQTGAVIGTPHYMSPEQIQGLPLDGRSDLYSLGILGFELLTGELPYQSPDQLSILYMHLQNPLPQLPEPYQALQPLLDKLLAKEPEQRFFNAEAFIAALEPFLGRSATGRITPVADPRTRDFPALSSEYRSASNGLTPAPVAEQAQLAPITNVVRFASALFARAQKKQQSTSSWGRKALVLLGLSVAVLAVAYLGGALQRTQPPQPPSGIVDEGKVVLDIAALESALSMRLTNNAYFEPPGQSAIDLLRRVQQHAPDDLRWLAQWERFARAVHQRVRELLASNQRAEGLSLLRQGLEVMPNNALLRELQAEILVELNQTTIPGTIDTQQSSVSELLDRAAKLKLQAQLTSPSGDNAVELYQQVLKREPGNVAAQQQLNAIAEDYLQVARTWNDRGRADQARAHVERGLMAVADHPALLKLRAQLARAP